MGKTTVNGDKIMFSAGPVEWQISSPINNFIQHLVMGTFGEGQKIRVGPEGRRVSFLIEHIETLPKPEFKEVMRFTCIAPITVSKLLVQAVRAV